MRAVDREVLNCPCCEEYWEKQWHLLEAILKTDREYIQLYCPTCTVPRSDREEWIREEMRW